MKPRFNLTALGLWLTPKERAAVDSLLKQAMQFPQLQTTLAELELEYGDL